MIWIGGVGYGGVETYPGVEFNLGNDIAAANVVYDSGITVWQVPSNVYSEVPYLAFGIPFEVLVLQSFFRQLPDELIEAAKMDGAGPWRIFFTLILPLSTPALVTVFILDAVSTWNEFLFALILLSSDANKTIPVGLLNFQGQFSNNNTGLAAGILIAVVPILIAYIFLQRWIVGGLTAGATKG